MAIKQGSRIDKAWPRVGPAILERVAKAFSKKMMYEQDPEKCDRV